MAVLHNVLPGEGGCTSHQLSPRPVGERNSEIQPGRQAAAGQRFDVSSSCQRLHANIEYRMAVLESEVTPAVNETRQRLGKTGLNPFLSSHMVPCLRCSAVAEADRRTLLELLLHRGSSPVLLRRNHASFCRGTLPFNTAIT